VKAQHCAEGMARGRSRDSFASQAATNKLTSLSAYFIDEPASEDTPIHDEEYTFALSFCLKQNKTKIIQNKIPGQGHCLWGH